MTSDPIEVLRDAAQELVEAIRAIPEEKLLELDADPHPPSALSELADDLATALRVQWPAPKPESEWVELAQELQALIDGAKGRAFTVAERAGLMIRVAALNDAARMAPKPESAESLLRTAAEYHYAQAANPTDQFGNTSNHRNPKLEAWHRQVADAIASITAPPRPEASEPASSPARIAQKMRYLAKRMDEGPFTKGDKLRSLADEVSSLPAPQQAPVGVKLPQVPFAVFDEFGVGADDRIMDYGRACAAAAIAQQPAAVDDLNAWRAAFVAERATRYREGGMAIEQARIHAETDAERMALVAGQQQGGTPE